MSLKCRCEVAIEEKKPLFLLFEGHVGFGEHVVLWIEYIIDSNIVVYDFGYVGEGIQSFEGDAASIEISSLPFGIFPCLEKVADTGLDLL